MNLVSHVVLLAEDDRFLRRAAELALRARGLTVITACDGAEALERATTAPPALLMLDMLMPKLSGLEVLTALRRDPRTRTLPVLMFSNSSRDADMKKAADLGVEGYWVKSDISLFDLGNRVIALLERLSEPATHSAH
jgi:two-component system, chemotaxis family, chemotaxis protein CheY